MAWTYTAFLNFICFSLATALAFLCGTACASGTGIEIDAAIELEAVHMEINFDGFCAFQKLFVDDVLVTIYVKLFISVVRLIQSHCQTGAASAAFVQKDPDRTDLLVAKICCDLFSSCRCYFEHDILLKKYWGHTSPLNFGWR